MYYILPSGVIDLVAEAILVTLASRLARRLKRDHRDRRKTIESCVNPSTQFAVPRDERDPLPGHDGALNPGRGALLAVLRRVHDPSPAEGFPGGS